MPQQSHERAGRGETLLRPLPDLVSGTLALLAASFLYVWLRVEPALEYHRYGPYFTWPQGFTELPVGRPGGLAGYFGVLLVQLNHSSWLGAAALVLSQGVVFLAALLCLVRVGGRAVGWAVLVPPFVLLLLRNRYGGPVAEVTVGLLLALGAAAAHLWVPWRRPWLASVVGGVVSGVLFHVAGLWPALLFAVLTAVFIIRQLGSWPAGVGELALACTVPLLAILVGSWDYRTWLRPPGEGIGWILAAVLYVSVPLTGMVWGRRPEAEAVPSDDPHSIFSRQAVPAHAPEDLVQTGWRRWAFTALAWLLGGVTVWFTFNDREKHLTAMDYYSSRGEHAAVLAEARKVRVLDHPAKARLLLALYHTGRLAEELFSFHNLVEDAPFERLGEDFRAQSEPLYELGLINDAEHTAHEAIELEGNHPDLLHLLARINLVKDRPQAAEVFLNVLGRMPFQEVPANPAWPQAGQVWPAAELAAVAGVRARTMTNDVLHDGLPEGRLLEMLLAANPTNRMAYEYLMAYHLLDLELKEAVERLPLLDRYHYAGIPRPYEEALLLFQQAAGVQAELKGRTIRPETVQRFGQFREALGRVLGKAGEQESLAASFGDTYWYYYYVARNRQLAAERQAAGP